MVPSNSALLVLVPQHASGVQFQKMYFFSAPNKLCWMARRGHRCDRRRRTFLRCPRMGTPFLVSSVLLDSVTVLQMLTLMVFWAGSLCF